MELLLGGSCLVVLLVVLGTIALAVVATWLMFRLLWRAGNRLGPPPPAPPRFRARRPDPAADDAARALEDLTRP